MTKTIKKDESVSVYPISKWSVSNYGVPLFVNVHPKDIKFKRTYSLDIEHDEKEGFVGIGISDGENCWWWNDFSLAKQLHLQPFVGHNGISDIATLKRWGFNVDSSFLAWDTMLMGHFIDSSRKKYGLKHLAKEDLGIVYPSYDDIVGKKTEKQKKERITLDKQPPELVAEYNAADCLVTYRLYEKQKLECNKLEDETIERFKTLSARLASLLYKIQEKGIEIDTQYLMSLKTSLEEQQKPIKETILAELGEINLGSPKQLLEALHNVGIRPSLKNKPSTDKRALQSLASYKVVSDLLKYSELDTLLSSFVIPYLERQASDIHPQYKQTGTRTGRLSCSNPNLQQIPRRTDNGKLVRGMFKAREGMLFGDCDFGQIEPRLLAHLSKDEVLCGMFNKGLDFHTFTSERLDIDRDRAKILNLSVGYKATFKSVSQQLKCSWNEAQQEIDAWWSMFPQLFDWQQKLIYESKKSGYCTTLLGRRIKVEDLNNGNQWRREGAERQLINNIVQGSAAEIMALGMLEVDKAGIDILVQVHDEILFESPEESIAADLQIAIDKLEQCIKIEVPLVVEGNIGKTWAQVH